MPINKVTSQQFAAQIAQGISSRDATVDTGFGPVPDIVINPVAQVLEQQNDRLRQVSLLISLQNDSAFSDLDVESLVFNEGLTRIQGSQATGTVVFSRSTAPTVDLTVQRGFPIATAPDESTGQSVTYVTTTATTMVAANASSYFNPSTGRYELSVPVICLTFGTAGIVGANRINRPLRPLVSFDTVTNPSAVVNAGTPQETNAQLISRYLSAVTGRQLSTAAGIKKYVIDKFPAVTDLKAVSGSDPLLTRAATDAGAVDAYIVSASTTQQTDTITFQGAGILHTVTLPPIVAVISVVNVTGAYTLIANVDYVTTLDTSGVSGSVRAQDGITVLSVPSASVPAVGDQLQVTYTYNTMVRDLQSDEAQEDVHVLGRDLLYRAATQINIVLTATLSAVSGFNPATIAATAQSSIVTFINSLGLGEPVQGSDIQGQVRQISGVDNFIITRMTTSDVATGTADINLNSNQYARTVSANVTIST